MIRVGLESRHLIRALTHAELVAADAQLAEWLVGESGTSLLRTYPQVFESAGRTTGFGAFDEHGVLGSHAAVRRVQLKTSRGVLATSLVGVVATNPAARGARLASRLMQRIAEDESACGQDLIVLWSDLWEFYAKLGYVVNGVQAEIEIARGAFWPSTRTDYVVRRATAHDLPTLVELHAAKPWGVVRDRAEMELLIDGTDTDVFVLATEGGVQAYACCTKGVDLGGWWHEVGGDDGEICELLPHAMAALDQEEATLILPAYRHKLFAAVGPAIRGVREGVVALTRPLGKVDAFEFFIDGLDSI